MTNNEIIARFDGATEFKIDSVGVVPSYGVPLGYWPELDEGRGDGWREVPDYADDEEIGCWHGPGGLLEKIEEKGIWKAVCREWMTQRVAAEDPPFDREMPYTDEIAWALRKATPAQLTDALVATIKEVEDG